MLEQHLKVFAHMLLHVLHDLWLFECELSSLGHHRNRVYLKQLCIQTLAYGCEEVNVRYNIRVNIFLHVFVNKNSLLFDTQVSPHLPGVRFQRTLPGVGGPTAEHAVRRPSYYWWEGVNGRCAGAAACAVDPEFELASLCELSWVSEVGAATLNLFGWYFAHIVSRSSSLEIFLRV